MCIGRWSELSVVYVRQSSIGAMCAEHKERSGDVLGPLEGVLVGVFSLRRHRLLPFKASISSSPRAAAAWSDVEENQAGLWALKSPVIKVSFVTSKSLGKLGEKPGGQEEGGGM
jgi:hypothetical protein